MTGAVPVPTLDTVLIEVANVLINASRPHSLSSSDGGSSRLYAVPGTARFLIGWGPAGVGDDPRCAQRGYAGSANQ